ncbi:DUF1090 family protein [Helicobacter anatolicus]|uniref:DUF1090 family protein n=1 Tax=Helicobacter anatolicus TaxID=2905874 RepID=UPI001E3577DD|nr:DUF1090 family protein [Helicobacter anatolicus]MCE3038289.1 DUF1090 domain-containing protein [Helicobacter anatolicus]
MRYQLIFLFLIHTTFADILCDFKISILEESLKIADSKKDLQKATQLKNQIINLKKHCDNTMILEESKEYIKSLQKQIAEKKQTLYHAQLSKNLAQEKNLKLEINLLHEQLIAAKQELLRLKDKLKE